MKNKSFTLIELLVVIVIIGILAGVIIVSVSSSINKATIAKLKVFENNIQNELGANMVSRWKLDEISGVTTPDAWGINTGTLGDGITPSTYPTAKTETGCVAGTCMSFDGINDYVQIQNSTTLEENYKGFTVSAWVKYTETQTGLDGYGYIVQKNINRNIGGAPFVLSVLFKKINFTMYNTTTSMGISSPLDYNDGNWHHVASVYDNQRTALYVDGINVKSIASISFTNNNGYLSIGGTKYDSTMRPFNGSIDDVRIYNGALSTSQIKQEYIAGLNSLLANNNISQEE